MSIPRDRGVRATGHRDSFRRAVGDVVGVPPDHVTLFWRGRVALYAILRALDIGPGDEVVVPAFTCVAVPNAILYTGARPVYADIDEATYTPDPDAVARAVGGSTRAVVAQNTFGLSSDLEALAAAAGRHGAVVIDDSTHGLGGTHRGRPNGAGAHAAFFSTQWSKPISTGLGGVAVTGDPALARELRSLEDAAAEPPVVEQALLRTMVWARELVEAPRALATGRTVYRALGRLGVVPGSSSSGELDGPLMPPGFLTRMSPVQAALGADRLASLREAVLRRRATAERYSTWLASHGCTPAYQPPCSTHAFLRYPLRVRERDAFLDDARRARLDLGDWFRSVLHPVSGDLEPWGYRWGTAPVAERVTAEIVNLPTDLTPGGRQLPAVERLLESSIDRII